VIPLQARDRLFQIPAGLPQPGEVALSRRSDARRAQEEDHEGIDDDQDQEVSEIGPPAGEGDGQLRHPEPGDGHQGQTEKPPEGASLVRWDEETLALEVSLDTVEPRGVGALASAPGAPGGGELPHLVEGVPAAAEQGHGKGILLVVRVMARIQAPALRGSFEAAQQERAAPPGEDEPHHTVHEVEQEELWSGQIERIHATPPEEVWLHAGLPSAIMLTLNTSRNEEGCDGPVTVR
jgi:hypothetical protein